MDSDALFFENPDEGWTRSDNQHVSWPTDSSLTATAPEQHLSLVSNLDGISWHGISLVQAFSIGFLVLWLMTTTVQIRHTSYTIVTSNRLTWQRFLRRNFGHVVIILVALGAPNMTSLPAGYSASGQLAYDLPELARVLVICSTTSLIRRALIHIERRSIASLQLGSPSPRLVTHVAHAILHGWCAAGATLAVSAGIRALAGRAARHPAGVLAKELVRVLPMVMSSRWMPPVLVLIAYALGTRLHMWIKSRGGLAALFHHGGNGEPLVLPRELLTMICALASFEYIDPLVSTFDKVHLHLLPGAWAGLYLSSGALLAHVALDLASRHHRVALSAPGTPALASHRSPKTIKRVELRSPSLAAQAKQLPHATSDDFANPPPVSPTLQRRVLLERFSPGKPQATVPADAGKATARRLASTLEPGRFEHLASNECLASPSPRSTPSSPARQVDQTWPRVGSPQLPHVVRFREPSPIRLINPGLFANQARQQGLDQQDLELKVRSDGLAGAFQRSGVGLVFGTSARAEERRGRSPARS